MQFVDYSGSVCRKLSLYITPYQLCNNMELESCVQRLYYDLDLCYPCKHDSQLLEQTS